MIFLFGIVIEPSRADRKSAANSKREINGGGAAPRGVLKFTF
jgi:hypothetical protein